MRLLLSVLAQKERGTSFIDIKKKPGSRCRKELKLKRRERENK